MINQHPQATIAELEEFIALGSNVREVRKAIAIKLVYQGYLYQEIQTILNVSLGSITGWKQAYEQRGVDGLRLNYKGRKSYLSGQQQEEVLSWLSTKNTWEIGELEYKLAFDYDVTYESKQSYYDLFEAAGISWRSRHLQPGGSLQARWRNKTTSLNPKASPDAVAEKKKRLKHCWQATERKSKQEC